MKSLFIFILCFSPLIIYGQGTKPSRHVAYFENPPVFGNQWGFELQSKVFEAAAIGKIKIYRFDSFNENPKEVDPLHLPLVIESIVASSFPKWNAKEKYAPQHYSGNNDWSPASTVSFKGKLYYAIEENQKINPTDTIHWKRVLPDYSFELIGLDYVSLPGDTALQYIHFFKKGMKYCVSFKAGDVVQLMNANKTVWFPNITNFASHVVGNLFTFYTNNDPFSFEDLWSQLDTAKLGSKKSEEDAFYQRTCVQMKDSKITHFVLGYGEHKFYGKVPFSKISKLIDGDRQEFWLKGDALANFKMFQLRKAKSTTDFKLLVLDIEKKSTPFVIEKIELFQEETFDFKDQIQENAFIDDMNKFLNLVFEGVAANKLKVYKDGTAQENYSGNELIKEWARYKIEEWKPNIDYDIDVSVLYKNEYYTSISFNNDYYPENGQHWEKGKIAIVQPEFVRSILLNSVTTFDTSGTILEKKYSIMKLERLGYFRYDEIRDYVQKVDALLFKNILKWMEDKGIFQVRPISLIARK